MTSLPFLQDSTAMKRTGEAFSRPKIISLLENGPKKPLLNGAEEDDLVSLKEAIITLFSVEM
jgi:hypothetical protein